MGLNLSALNLAEIKTEIDAGVPKLVSAIEVAEKFDFLFPQLAPALQAAVAGLDGLKSVVDKL